MIRLGMAHSDLRGDRIRMRIGYRIWDMGRKIKIKIKIKMKEAAGCRLQVGPDL
jgi:hypothetical protein